MILVYIAHKRTCIIYSIAKMETGRTKKGKAVKLAPTNHQIRPARHRRRRAARRCP